MKTDKRKDPDAKRPGLADEAGKEPANAAEEPLETATGVPETVGPGAADEAGAPGAAPAEAGAVLATVSNEANEKAKSRLFSVQRVNGKKRLMMYGVECVYLYFMGIIVAFIGWLAENIAHIVLIGNIDCRYHLLPFISPYALIVFAFHIAVGDMDHFTFFGHRVFKKDTLTNRILSNVIILFSFCFLVFFGELAVGNLWDACFGVQLWNYIDYPLHLTRYASVVTAALVGGGAYIIFRLLYKPSLNFIRRRMNFRVAQIICWTLGIAIVLDTCWMILCIIIFHNPPMYWSIRVR